MSRPVIVSNVSCIPCALNSTVSPAESVQRVIDHLCERIGQALPDRPDLVVLPECCDRPSGLAGGCEGAKAYYRARGDRVLDRMRVLAREHRCYIAYPYVRELPDGTWRNSVFLLDRQGETAGVYNKNHVTIGEFEKGILYGREAPVFDCDFGRVSCAVCFDLNFEELLRRTAAARPDLILFCSMFHGGLQQAWWAYACRAHFVGCIGGGCPGSILSPVGETLAETTNYVDFVTARINLDCCVAHLDFNWERLAALKRKYGPAVTIRDPGRLGSVVITSESADRDALAMAREFEIERLDDYFERVRAHRSQPGRIEP